MPEKPNGKYRPRLDEEEWNLILAHRNKTLGDTSFKQDGENAEYSFKTSNQIKTLQNLIDACDIDLTQWDIERWICNKWEVGAKDERERIQVTPLFQVKVWLRPKKGKTFIDLKDEIIKELKSYAPTYKKINYKPPSEPHLLVIDPADVHIGKLCSSFETREDYDAAIATERIRSGVQGILDKAKGFGVDKIMLIVGNDILHVDTPKNTTTSGTHQDTHLMWYDAFRIAKQIYVEVIETLMQVAPLHIQYDPSNHDYTNGFFLADTLQSWFSKSKDVTFNASISHRKYFVYGNNLIGTTHGDGAKEGDLPLLMAHEAAEFWAKCVHRYFYTHHIHHKKSKDYMSVCVEALRSPSGADSWHDRNGFAHAPKAIEGFIHSKEHGQIARITHLF